MEKGVLNIGPGRNNQKSSGRKTAEPTVISVPPPKYVKEVKKMSKEDIEEYWEMFELDKTEAVLLESEFNSIIKDTDGLKEIHKEICKRWSKGSEHDFLVFWMGYAIAKQEKEDINDEENDDDNDNT